MCLIIKNMKIYLLRVLWSLTVKVGQLKFSPKSIKLFLAAHRKPITANVSETEETLLLQVWTWLCFVKCCCFVLSEGHQSGCYSYYYCSTFSLPVSGSNGNGNGDSDDYSNESLLLYPEQSTWLHTEFFGYRLI